MVYTAQVVPRKWIKGQVYQRSELPPTTVTYQPPPAPLNDVPKTTAAEQYFTDPAWFQQDDVVPMSLTALREIFRQFSPSELPADFAACLAGNTQAIAANHAAYQHWESNRERRRVSEALPHQGTSLDATENLTQTALMPHPVPQPTSCLNRPMEHAPSQESLSAVQQATVHRTGPHMPRGKRTQGDISLQVCSDKSFMRVERNEKSWEPHFLFPELCTSQSELNCTAKGKQGPTHNTPLLQLPPRVPKNRINKKTNGENGLVNIDAQAFIDVPLQEAEGREFLALIGAGSIPIPSHVMLHPQQSVPIREVGQSSKAQTKRRKNTNSAQETGLQPKQGPMPGTNQAHEAQQGSQGNREPQPAQFKRGPEIQSPDDAAVSPPLTNAQLDVSHVQDDDPYLDQVDYSDDDLNLDQ